MMARITSLPVTPSGRLPSTRHAHVLGRLLDQRLGGEHVLDLRGADAEGQRAERAVRRGVAVAAHDGHARQGQALLGADHVHDAAARHRPCRSRAPGSRRRSSRASRPGCAIPRPCRPRRPAWSACCGRRRRWWRRGGAPGGSPCAGPRRPAGWSPRGRGDGRCRSRRCRRPGDGRRGCPRSSRTGCAAAAAGRRRGRLLAERHGAPTSCRRPWRRARCLSSLGFSFLSFSRRGRLSASSACSAISSRWASMSSAMRLALPRRSRR